MVAESVGKKAFCENEISVSLKGAFGTGTYEGQENDHARQREGKPPDLPVRNSLHETVHLTTALGLRLIADTDILLHTLLGKADLKRTQPAVRSRREIGENENGAESREHGESAFDVEQPPARL